MKQISCFGKDVKSLLIDEIKGDAEVESYIKGYPTCGVGIPLELEEVRGRGTRKKRAPSAYNVFIGKCMKAKKIKKFGEASGAMKACATEWRKIKAK